MREGKLPLRTILQNFINHVDTLEAKRNEGDDQYEQEFQDLKLLTESLKSRAEYCCLEGEKDVNRRKNRYKDILPYDYTRVVVSSFPGVPGSDYINGNYIRGASGSRAYIASQGPLPNTTADFWRMVVECEVQVIIMASNETEGGKHKCECYWVNNTNEEKQFGNVTVSFVKARQVCPDFMVRTLKIKYRTDSGKLEERTICQFHYVLWPDHGVPETVRPLLDMVRLVRDCQASETLPVLVHCSAGCGRTGTICAIDYVWGLLRTGRLTENLNLFGLVKEMRRQRVAMVQTREQYILLHRAVRELFKERLKVIDAHPYENIATDGTPLILREKESDYEELYVKPEKQDESAKPTPPTTSPSAVSTPTGSLTRYSNTRGNNDYLASSSPINTLERPVAPVPPLPLKLSKPPPVTSYLPTHTSPSPHISPIPQPSTVHNHCSPVPQPSPVSLASFNQAHRSYSTSPSLATVSSMLQPVVTITSSGCSPGGSHHFPQLSPSHFHVTQSSSKLGIHPTSKLEKEAENAAHKRQVAHPSGCSPASGVTQRTMHTPNMSGSPQPLSSGATTPMNTPNHTPTPLHNLSMSKSTHLSPIPPVRSRTPSPGITYGRSVEEGKHSVTESSHIGNDASNKSTEIVRRPSIAELKELFEKAGDAETPGVRLSRSASSVTSRTSLSIHPDAEGGIRNKRKTSLGAEETIQSKKVYEMLERSRQLNICPPPPHDISSVPAVSTAPVTIISAEKPPSSPIYTSPLSRRRATHVMNDSHDENSHSALLARVDDRPALPVKKSKSFRYARPVDSSTNTIASTRSPELMRKKADINTYFSLDRGKGDSFSLSKSESGSVNFIGDIPSPREGFKLSVYQMPNTAQAAKPHVSGSETKDQTFSETKLDQKPQIPPKKIIGERFRNARPPDSLYISAPQPYTPTTMYQATTTPHTPQSAPPVVSLTQDTSSFWNRNQVDRSIYDCPKELQATSGLNFDNLPSTSNTALTTNSQIFYTSHSDAKVHPASATSAIPRPSPTSELSQETTGTKEYVNARVVRNPNTATKESSKYVYLPLPTKRGSRDNKAPHEYANCSLSGPSQSDSMEGEEPTDIYMDPQVVKKTTPGKFPVYDEVAPTLQPKSEATILKSRSKENLSVPMSTTVSPGPLVTPALATTPGSADYEVMDFGETSTSVDEVFETINYEILGPKERRTHKSTDSKLLSESLKDFCSKKDLDPIARQVYLDCQDYLLHGTNKSPVPSLMPKPAEKEAKKVTKSGDNSKGPASDSSMDVDEVKSKVNVAPQGLRTRERRNSYRQAVNPVIQNEPKTPEEKTGRLEHTRSIHKYETIWFENGKHMMRRNNSSPTSQQNFQQMSKSMDREDFSQPRGSSSVYMQVKNPLAEEHGSNFNQSSNSKDSLFKEKLEELHTLVSSLERQKPRITNPKLQEDDANSKGSGSNNSTLQSHSTSSSRDSEHQEPIYVNTPISRSLSSSNKGQLPPKATRNCDSVETRSPPPLRHSRTEGKLENIDLRPGQQSPIINANSLYGTIATSTLRTKPPGSNSSSPSFQNISQTQTKPPSPYNSLVPTATLPSKATISPTPYHNIPPPKGFGNGTSPGNSPNPLHSMHQNRDNHEGMSSSHYNNMAMFNSGKSSQLQRNIPVSSPGQDSNQMSKGGFSPYSPPLITNVVRQNFVHNQASKAHIIGDIAIVGEESVRLRRPGQTLHARTDVGSGCSSNDSRGSEGAPVAPPRIKRNSTAGLPRHSAVEPSLHGDRRCSTDGQENYRQTILTAKQSWPLTDDEPPPAVPAKTAAAYQYPDPPPPPPHNHPPSPHHLPLNHTHSPYIQPPPPKPVLPQSSLLQQHPQHPQPPVAQPVQNSPYQPVPHPSKKFPNQNSLQEHHHRSPKPLSETGSEQKDSSSANQNKQTVVIQNRTDDVAVIESTSESSDDEGIFHKFPPANLFKKWRSNSNKQTVPPIPSSPKATSFHFSASKEMKEERDIERDNQRGLKDQHKDNNTVPSPTSPKPLVKALEKLRFNSKSVAANFKSYLSPRGDKIENDSGGGAEGHLNDSPGGNFVNSSGSGTRNIQKSASSGPNITAFSQVVQDYKYPNPIPKKPAGPRDMPAQMRGSTPTNSQVKVKTSRPRQQYL